MTISPQYTWTAFYEDGSSIQEFDDERPDGREWAALPEKHIGVLVLNHVQFPLSFYVKVPDDAEAVFTRRHILVLGLSPDNPVPEEVQPRTMVHIIGWKKHGEDGEGAYNFLCDNGVQLFSNDFQAM